MGGLPCPFFKIEKEPWFWEKNTLAIFIYEWVKFIIQNAVLSVPGKKSPKYFPAGHFFRVLQIKFLSKCPYFKNFPLDSKIPGYVPDNNVVLIILLISF